MTYENVYGAEAADVEEINPTVPSSAVTFDTLTKVLSWVRGDGERSMVIASIYDRAFVPLDGVTYNGIISQGVREVYKGADTSVNLTDKLDFNLSSIWYLFIYEFNGVQSTEKYLRRKYAAVNLVVFITEDGDVFINEDDSGRFSPEGN